MKKPSEFTVVLTTAFVFSTTAYLAELLVQHCAEQSNVVLGQAWVKNITADRNDPITACIKRPWRSLLR